ncbi:hypothetical protein LJR039_003707 [Pseudorhodoferax sp. LjRoot39]|uniref:hypothetical protein n=1 Tax=Pseudorhodoferax sp. LjRoot39 TaxID=3342328 RepID=UPI003ECF3A24
MAMRVMAAFAWGALVATGAAQADTSKAPERRAAKAEHCQPRTEFVPALCTVSLPAIKRVVIERNARASPSDGAEPSDCSRFRLSPRQVRRFFALVRRIDDPNPEHAMDRGPCHAEGRVTFADGRTGHWRIEQTGSATLSVGNDAPLALMCVRCNWSPFRL